MVWLFGIVALMVGLLAAPARAATVEVQDADPREGDAALSIQAAPGEANDLTITGNAAGGAKVAAGGTPLTAGPGCALSAGTATCSPGAGRTIDVVFALLGDRADRLVARNAGHRWNRVLVLGGPGGDSVDLGGARTNPEHDLVYPVEVTGGPGEDTLLGSPGRDDAGGGAGRDVLRGRAGGDRLEGDGAPEALDHPAHDVIDGGRGPDLASYASHARRVVVDLAHPSAAGARGERDRLRRIEGVIGSRFSDVLRGTAGPNELQGEEFLGFRVGPERADRMTGRGGRDELIGTPAADRLAGGAGPDTIRLVAGRDRVRCGSGRDTFVPGATPVLFPRACERLDDDSYTYTRFRVAHGRLVGHLHKDFRGGLCHEGIHLRSRGGGVRYGDREWNNEAPPRLAVRLTAAGRAAAARHRIALVRELGCSGTPTRWLLRL